MNGMTMKGRSSKTLAPHITVARISHVIGKSFAVSTYGEHGDDEDATKSVRNNPIRKLKWLARNGYYLTSISRRIDCDLV
jgi:hypothetical protein